MPAVKTGPTFADLGLSSHILKAVTSEGYTHPTPIQAQSIPHTLEGKDVLGCAQTGTGKTAAFALPILHRLSRVDAGSPHPHPNQHHHRPIRAVILSPTRELAVQIEESFRTYGRHTHLRTVCIFGGVNQGPQTRALRQGVDIVIATPGRLMDLMEQGYVDLSSVEIFVLDEADRMLDMGFIDPIRKIAGEVPKERQTLLFSATMPKAIRHLADALLSNPVSVQVAATSSTPDRVKQQVVFVPQRDKPDLLVDMINKVHVDRCLVFTRTKHSADRVAKHLNENGIPSDAIHGNKRQNVRQRSLAAFKTGRIVVLVATDIAARGIDVDNVTHVVNFDMPNEPETYVHRIGRTARAGASGEAVSFVDRASDERHYLRDIERLTKRSIPARDANPRQASSTPRPAVAVAGEGVREGAESPAGADRPKIHTSRPAPSARPEHGPRVNQGSPSRSPGARPEGRGERPYPPREERREFAKSRPPHAHQPRGDDQPRREGFGPRPAPRGGEGHAPKSHAKPAFGARPSAEHAGRMHRGPRMNESGAGSPQQTGERGGGYAKPAGVIGKTHRKGKGPNTKPSKPAKRR